MKKNHHKCKRKSSMCFIAEDDRSTDFSHGVPACDYGIFLLVISLRFSTHEEKICLTFQSPWASSGSSISTKKVHCRPIQFFQKPY